MVRNNVIGLVAMVGVSVCSIAGGQVSAPPAYRLVDFGDVKELLQELESMPANGFGVAFGASPSVLVLRRWPATQQAASWRLLLGDEAVESAATNGMRIVPGTLDSFGVGAVAIGETVTDSVPRQNLLIRERDSDALAVALGVMAVSGYRLVALSIDDDGHVALVESGHLQGPEATESVTLVAANRQDTLQEELAAKAQAGFRILAAASWKETVLGLARPQGDVLPIEYLVLSATRSGTLEREMNEAAREGYRFVPGTLGSVQKGANLFGRVGAEFVAIMERAAAAKPAYEYSFLGARRFRTLVRELEETDEGYAPVALTLGYQEQDNVAILERERVPGQ